LTISPTRPAPSATSAAADPRAVVEGPGFRITVLTSRLLRLERQAENRFTDERTQLVLRRRFPVPEFAVSQTDDSLDLWTDHLHLRYDKQPFSPGGLSVTLRRRAQRAHFTTWHYGDPVRSPHGRPSNLGGTARTLDDADGPVELEPGLLSLHGYAVVDDSASLVITEDGWVAPGPGAESDLYFFGYGRDYAAALRDFFALTGPSPLLPRWTLGNWWSRFHRYSADEYLALMDRFRNAGIPFSVAVLDMDWHLVDIDPRLGSGWTGYTWNTDLFPDPAAFLAALHERNLRVALNVHPADGVRSHEAAYAAVAAELGLDPSTGREIAFDITSRDFVAAYLRHLHHPHEDAGVDFWWLDWQSGTNSRVAGLDPLWMLNHVHYQDSGRAGKRPLTFSRYAGLGSHRYPVGFSGDSVTTWASLDFQPYFTATAANVGYHWWSHDIGGHLGGIKDDELATRWVQLGVFSPINRLHSSSSPFNSKEPWRFGREAERVMSRYLALRHQLVPYLYSAMWDAHTDGVAPVRPMYHAYPEADEAYEVPNQYVFGPSLLVAPITSPTDDRTHHAAVTAWLPDGTWFDIFDGRRYQGGRMLHLHRTLEDIPVLARAGTILPLAADPAADVASNPDAIVVKVFVGAKGEYVLVEDDGSAVVDPADRHETGFAFRWDERGDGSGLADATLRIAPPTGAEALTRRDLSVEICGAESVESATLSIGAAEPRRLLASTVDGATLIRLGPVDLTRGAMIQLATVRPRSEDVGSRVFHVLDQAEIAYDLKTRVMHAVDRLSPPALLAALPTLALPGNLQGIITEIVTAARC
jgi:alpha-glucosidase (family GH31 glycosyl hydrolase)